MNCLSSVKCACVCAHDCRLKAYIVDFLGQKINLSEISPAKRSRSRSKSVYMDIGQVKGRQRSGNFGRNWPIFDKMGAGMSPAEQEVFLFGKSRDISATSQWPIFTKFGHET